MSDRLAALRAACAELSHAGPGELDAALARAEALAAALAGEPEQAAGLVELALCCWSVGRLREAEPMLVAAAELHAGAGRSLEAARCRANLGLLEKERGRFAAALFLLDGVRPTFEEDASPLEQARLDLNRASLLADLGRFAQAREQARAAGGLLAAHGQVAEAGRARWIDAAAAEGLRLYQEALDLYRDAAALMRQADLPAEAAQIAVNVGEIYRRLGDRDLALRSFDAAEAELGPGRTHHHAALRLNRAAALASAGRTDEAIAAARDASDIYHDLGSERDQAESELLQARLLLDRGEHAAAQAVLLDARQQMARDGTPHEAAAADLLLAELGLAIGNAAVVKMCCHGVIDQVPEPLADLHQRAWRLLMRLAEQQGDQDEALRCGRRAVEALERLGAGVRHDLLRHRFDVAVDQTELYGAVLAILIERGSAAEALELMQRAKARALIASVGEEQLLPVDAEPGWQAAEQAAAARVNELLAEADGIRTDRARYEAWRERLIAARGELTALHLQLAQLAPDAALLRGLVPEPVDAERLAALLGPRALFLECYAVGDDLCLVAAFGGQLRAAWLAGAMRVAGRLLDRFHAGLQMLGGAPAALLPRLLPGLRLGAGVDGRELCGLLLGPFEDWLDGAESLVIAPHGRLWEIPPAVLDDGLEPLVARLDTALAPSASSLVRLAARPVGRGLGTVAVGGEDCRLAAVAGELAALGEGAARLSGPAATREAVLAAAPAAAMVHFAGHAEFRTESPLFSALRLAEGQRLTALDLYGARLRADLVTLAGCETGRQHGVAAGELVGLARALLYAGSRCVVATLWPVPDQATAALMRELSASLRRGLGPAAALRAAQQQVREATGHPFYWGGFVAIGAPG